MNISKLADYITIVTGSIFVVTSVRALFTGLPLAHSAKPESLIVNSSLLLIELAIWWLFSFFATFRFANYFCRRMDSEMTMGLMIFWFAVGAIFFGATAIIVVELYFPMQDWKKWVVPCFVFWGMSAVLVSLEISERKPD